jgi:hypothetical protein
MSLGDLKVADAIALLSVLVAAGALVFSALAQRDQARSHDFNNYLNLKDKFAEAWRRYSNATPDKAEFEFREVLNLIESVCHLFNEDAIHGSTRQMVEQYLREIIHGLHIDPAVVARINAARYSPETFQEIRTFASKHQLLLL